MHDFEPWSWMHWSFLALTAGIVTSVCLLGRAIRRSPNGTFDERRLRHAVAWVLVVMQILKNLWWMWPTRFDITVSLPLQMCDLLELLLPLALLAESPRLRGIVWPITWFWGVGLSTQAFFTPVLTHGYDDTRFWLFWYAHIAVLTACVYLVAVLGYRPTLRDLARTIPFGLVFVAIATTVNLTCNANYGFMGNHVAAHPTLVDRLGPWPLRVVWLYLLANLAMLLTWLPFAIARVLAGQASTDRVSTDDPSKFPSPEQADEHGSTRTGDRE